MKNLTLILLAVVAIGCDDMQKTAMNVIREPAATEIADVLIYTRITWWITPTEATAEAEITKQLLVSKGIKAEITESELFVRDWMQETKRKRFCKCFNPLRRYAQHHLPQWE